MSIKKNKLRNRFSREASQSFININSSLENDKFLFNEDIEASIAHATMLSSQKIISNKDAKNIISGLKKIKSEIKNKKFVFDDNLEDIHMNIEHRLAELIGQAAERLHTGRSRNDQVVTDLKLWMKKDNRLISKKIKKLKLSLIQVANKNISILFPGLTHLQTAQPISAGHFFMAYYEMFNRDTIRYSDAFKRINENPLGAGALAGTNFPINRNKTTKMLGFKRPTRNSIDTVSDRDFVVDFLSSSSLLAVHLSRLAEEIAFYCSDLVNFFKIGDQLMSSSSIMPQKKNPDGAELIRAKASLIQGNLSSMLSLLKSLPLTYSKDLQEDKVLVTSSSKNIHLCLDCMYELISSIQINKSIAEQKLKFSYANATELADWLVLNLGYSFRKAHNLTAQIVNFAEKKNINLNKISMKDFKKFDKNIDKSVYETLDLKNSINNKKSYGGTAISEIRKMISLARNELKNEKY
tara:strand:- start:15690 stop:17087 length:1398 start_codon:yes stop_codon:yes gene_type:complete